MNKKIYSAQNTLVLKLVRDNNMKKNVGKIKESVTVDNKEASQAEQITFLLVQAEALKVENERLRERVTAKKRRAEKSFRIETTKTSNNFHLSYNSIFDTEDVKNEFSEYMLEENEDEVVFSKDLRNALSQRVIESIAFYKANKD